MNPKPFFVSNHFTLPDAIASPFAFLRSVLIWQTAVPKTPKRRCTSKDFGGKYRKSAGLVNAGVGADPVASEQRSLEGIFGGASESYVAKSFAGAREVHFQNSPALHRHFHGQRHPMHEMRNNSRSNHACTASQRLGFHAALIRAHPDCVAADRLHPINIRPARGEICMVTHFRPDILHHFAVRIIREEHSVRNSCVNEMIFAGSTLELNLLPKPQLVWFAHCQANMRTIDGGLDEARARLELQVALARPTTLAKEPRNATRPVAAHLRFAPIRVVVAHEEINDFRRLDQQQPIRSHPKASVTNVRHDRRIWSK